MLNSDRSTVKHVLHSTQNDCHECFLTALECSEFVFGRSPRLPSWFKGVLILKGEEGGGRERNGGIEGQGRRG